MTLASLLAHSGDAFDGFVMFWLVMMLCINFSEGVRCLHCKDNILPGHAPADCPLVVLHGEFVFHVFTFGLRF